MEMKRDSSMEMICGYRMELMKDQLKKMMKGKLMVLRWMEILLGLPMVLLSMDWMTGQLMEISWEQRMELMKD